MPKTYPWALITLILFPLLPISASYSGSFSELSYIVEGQFPYMIPNSCTGCYRLEANDTLLINHVVYNENQSYSLNLSVYLPIDYATVPPPRNPAQTVVNQNNRGQLLYNTETNQNTKELEGVVFPTFIVWNNWEFWRAKQLSGINSSFSVNVNSTLETVTINRTTIINNATYVKLNTYDFSGLLIKYSIDVTRVNSGVLSLEHRGMRLYGVSYPNQDNSGLILNLLAILLPLVLLLDFFVIRQRRINKRKMVDSSFSKEDLYPEHIW